MDCHCEDYDDEAIALRTKTSVRHDIASSQRFSQ
jgi:hypothetical protein